MTAINISSDIATSFTTVSDIFIDQYMPKANGEFVKVYLYLLRATGSGAGIATISEIADHFSNTEADIIRALNYWASEGILQLQSGADGQIMGINLCSLSVSGMQAAQSNIQSAVADNAAQNNLQNSVVNNAAQNISTANIRMQDSVVEKLKSQTTDKAASSQKEYTLDEIKEFRKNPDISELFFIIETYLKHTLSSTDTNMVLYWLDELHFSTDLVEYLVEYCITKGHSSLRYMNKVALGWADAGIKTVDQAKDDAAAHSQIYYSVMKALGITGRNLVDSEVSLINKWVGEYGFDIELVKAACNKTISAIQKPSFEYTDSILANWRKKDVHTLKDVEVLDANFAKANKASATGSSQSTNATNGSSKPKSNNSSSKNKFNNFNQRNNDYDKLEKLFLNSTV
ncbi:DnaD domain protein [Agathobacter rectalis]|jgi:DnaD/phage-associated family protein|uniref:DnaD domain protein n=1 Tax=Agathobacter rectalis TaxID=39491 RepID=UPI00156FC945|nr:DnaD domain protein [Agathobacter rectalis]NSI31412.1 DnaD domain protein [Agathobacter rectalis]NSI85377.1 DnaD domain protein [Agathobacter rectalis]